MSKAVRLIENYLKETAREFEIMSVLTRKYDYEFLIVELDAINEKIEYKLYVNKHYDGKIYNAFDEIIN